MIFSPLFPELTDKSLYRQLNGESMFEGLFQPMHLLVLVGIALLVFGPKKLPELGKGLGDAFRGFKRATSDEKTIDPTSGSNV